MPVLPPVSLVPPAAWVAFALLLVGVVPAFGPETVVLRSWSRSPPLWLLHSTLAPRASSSAFLPRSTPGPFFAASAHESPAEPPTLCIPWCPRRCSSLSGFRTKQSSGGPLHRGTRHLARSQDGCSQRQSAATAPIWRSLPGSFGSSNHYTAAPRGFCSQKSRM